jgi:serine O-acetyltransferase
MLDTLREDVRTARETDPAAKSTAEVLLYAGLHAVWLHRIAHWLDEHGHRLTARALAQVNRLFTGVEIDPGAELGRRVFIDHGMGVVIGETAEIGDDVNMYHGVTLGGNDPRAVKRHPTIADGATLGAQSTLVGDITVGEGAAVGAGAVVSNDVPPGATVVGNPAERIDDTREDERDSSETTEDETEAPGEEVETPAEEGAVTPADDETSEDEEAGCPPVEAEPAWVPSRVG